MTGSVAVAHAAHAAPAMATLAATGVQRAAWLLLALPLAGAVVLLLGGKRTDKFGHLIGVAMPVAAFCYGLIAFFAMLSYPASQRSRDLHLFTWIPVGRLPRGHRPAARPAVDVLRAADHRRRIADPHLRGRLHGGTTRSGGGSSGT